MVINNSNKVELSNEGFIIIDNVFSEEEVNSILNVIAQADEHKPAFRKTADLFAIRQFLKEVPEVCSLLFTQQLKTIVSELFGGDYFITKSIYFDKPELSNWFVAYHQDLTISVDKKIDLQGYDPWTVKHTQFAVQPPVHILENSFTIRIHLDVTDEKNGALKVIPKSHLKGIYRPETIDWEKEKEETCGVGKGGIMIMKPLLLHASNRTVNKRRRRVVHLELNNFPLPTGLHWAEKIYM